MRIVSCYFRRLVIATIGLLVALVCFIQLIKLETWLGDSDDSNEEKLLRISQLIKNSNDETRYVGDGVPACKLPELDITNPDIMKFIHDVPALQCSPDDWVKVDGSKLFIDKKAKTRYGQITCAFREILRLDDFNYERGSSTESEKYYVLRESDYAEVKCESQQGKQWNSILAGVREEPEPAPRPSPPSGTTPLGLNVLMFGFDSLSRNTFARKLPRSQRYLEHALGGQILAGYNIVGDGTPQALIPILTGKIELELPETRRRMGAKASHVNVYPMIWRDFAEAGYRTGFMEDVPDIGTFTYRLKGFNKQPTDHYMRTYYLAAQPYFTYSKKFCMGGVPRHMLMLNYIKAIFDKHKSEPKFVFGFHGELSHDSYNDIGVADEDLLNWLKSMKEAGHLNNTILILMSDHGHRFADIRNTLQGKQEERLPFFSFTFPPWFKQVHPQAYANFIYNTQRLTTPFDIHATFKHMLDFVPPKKADLSERGISLFDKVPLERTCSDAFIEPHWCACLSWEEIAVDRDTVQDAAQYFIDFLNAYTEEHRDICEILQLDEIQWAAKLIPTKGIMHFEKSRDADGFVADLNAKTQLTAELYQLKLKTLPGNGLFEVSITHDVQKNTFFTKISDVSRINMYGSQATCVENHRLNLFHLRKYCYCKL